MSNQVLGNQNPLLNVLNFWLKSKHRWSTYLEHSLHQISRSSPAEAAQSSMKTDSGKNLSLLNVVINSAVDSPYHQANTPNHEADEWT